MAAKILGRHVLKFRKFGFRGASSLVQVSRHDVAGHNVAVLGLNSPPVNAFSSSLLAELVTELRILNSGKAEQTHGLIITSALNSVFSAGLDLNELVNPSEPELQRFWNLCQEMWLQLYTSPLPVASAINGHCLAAGTIIAASCDYRVALEGNYGIGVPAARIGLFAPWWFQKMLVHLMGHRMTELSLQQGQIFEPLAACKIGLVDKLCAMTNDVVKNAISSLKPFMSVSTNSRVKMKLTLRQALIEEFMEKREEDCRDFIQHVGCPDVQKELAEYIEKLKKKT